MGQIAVQRCSDSLWNRVRRIHEQLSSLKALGKKLLFIRVVCEFTVLNRLPDDNRLKMCEGWVGSLENLGGSAATARQVNVHNGQQQYSNVLGRLDDSLQGFLVLSGAAAEPGGDAVGQHTFQSTRVDIYKKVLKRHSQEM